MNVGVAAHWRLIASAVEAAVASDHEAAEVSEPLVSHPLDLATRDLLAQLLVGHVPRGRQCGSAPHTPGRGMSSRQRCPRQRAGSRGGRRRTACPRPWSGRSWRRAGQPSAPGHPLATMLDSLPRRVKRIARGRMVTLPRSTGPGRCWPWPLTDGLSRQTSEVVLKRLGVIPGYGTQPPYHLVDVNEGGCPHEPVRIARAQIANCFAAIGVRSRRIPVDNECEVQNSCQREAGLFCDLPCQRIGQAFARTYPATRQHPVGMCVVRTLLLHQT